MSVSEEDVRKYLGPTDPLSEAEIAALAHALRDLEANATPVPQRLMRHAIVPDGVQHYGQTLRVVPQALDLLGPEREKVVVGLLSRFEQAVRDNHDYAKNRKPGDRYGNEEISKRYFDVVFFLSTAKPKTEESVTQISDFLRSEKDEVHHHAAEMLQGTPYFPVTVDRLLENISEHGFRQFPNQQARTLASFAHIPEVRQRLMNCFRSPEQNLRQLGILTFACLKKDAGAEAELELFSIAKDDKNSLQASALNALHQINPNSRDLRLLGLRLIRSERYWVRGNAIACLEPFEDQECVDALLESLLDPGGHDFDNAGEAAKQLERKPLAANGMLQRLMRSLEVLLERESRANVEQSPAITIEQATGEWRIAGSTYYPNPELLLAVGKLLARLGSAAAPAIPLLEGCMTRPQASSTEKETWQKILQMVRESDARGRL